MKANLGPLPSPRLMFATIMVVQRETPSRIGKLLGIGLDGSLWVGELDTNLLGSKITWHACESVVEE